MMATLNLAAQIPPRNGAGPATFTFCDGSVDTSPLHGYASRLSGILPHSFRMVNWREVPTALGELHEELLKRQQNQEMEGSPLYLLIWGLQRFRDLRRNEDDFGGFDDKPLNPAKQLAAILKEGPSFKIFTIVWCDSLNNLNRCFDRHAMREFELRIVFQMSQNDSSNLIDTPIASRLGVNRAYFFSEEQGRLEKFRPYGLPTDEWLRMVSDKLKGRKQPVPVPSGNGGAATTS
jgi:hypothetical protein